jgi:hypothetical protein
MRPFGLTNAARSCFQEKEVKTESGVLLGHEVRVKKTTKSQQDEIYEEYIQNEGLAKVEDIPNFVGFQICHAIHGGVFSNFYELLKTLKPFQDYIEDSTRDETNITWQQIREDFIKMTTFELGKLSDLIIYV